MSEQVNANNSNDLIDLSAFNQILEMDDDEDDRDFSKELVYGFFDQADVTFDKMEKEIKSRNLEELSSLGHYLKGSSATLGIQKVRESCSQIQHLGMRKDETGLKDINDQEALQRIEKILPTMKQDYQDAKKWLVNFFKGKNADDGQPSVDKK